MQRVDASDGIGVEAGGMMMMMIMVVILRGKEAMVHGSIGRGGERSQLR